MADATKQASGKLSAAIAEAARVIASMAASARDMNRLPTATLLGVLGGGTFTLVSYVATIFFPGNFLVIGPLAAIVGIPSGVLLSRRISNNSNEANAEARRIDIERNREVAQLLRDEMNKPGNSKAAKDDLAKKIAVLNDELAKMGLLEYKPQIPMPVADMKLLSAPAQNL